MPLLGLNPANYNPMAATSLLSSDAASLQSMDPMALLSALFSGSTGSAQGPQESAAIGPTTAATAPAAAGCSSCGSSCSCGGGCAQGGACSCGCSACQRSNELGF